MPRARAGFPPPPPRWRSQRRVLPGISHTTNTCHAWCTRAYEYIFNSAQRPVKSAYSIAPDETSIENVGFRQRFFNGIPVRREQYYLALANFAPRRRLSAVNCVSATETRRH